jgi:hydroxymethylbilane synthase
MPLQATILRIGTRGSPLALVQARDVRDRLAAAHGLDPAAIEIRVIKTSGDKIQDRPLSEVGGKGLFTKEIEEALIAREIDLAVHSMKDVATVLPGGLIIAACLPREDTRDAFISLKHGRLAELPAGAVLGTSSLRRQAQILRTRPDVKVIGFRGNVETRLRKLADNVADATLLACAGLNRLGLRDRITAPVPIDEMLPAVAQGAVGIECREEDATIRDYVQALDHRETSLCVAAERAFLRKLDGSCRTPIAGLATLTPDGIAFRGEILTPDGREHHATVRSGQPSDGARLCNDAAEELLKRAGPRFFEGQA